MSAAYYDEANCGSFHRERQKVSLFNSWNLCSIKASGNVRPAVTIGKPNMRPKGIPRKLQRTAIPKAIHLAILYALFGTVKTWPELKGESWPPTKQGHELNDLAESFYGPVGKGLGAMLPVGFPAFFLHHVTHLFSFQHKAQHKTLSGIIPA